MGRISKGEPYKVEYKERECQKESQRKREKAQTMSPSPFQSQTTFSAWPSPEATLQASTSQTQAPVAPDSFATSSSSTTAAALAGHIELVTVVRKQYPDIGKAPSDIQAAVKKADQALSKQLGSDLHKASTQITKAPKQLNTLRDAKNKHRESWLRHLKDSVTGWENQIKAFQEQQKQYMDQINKAKAEIQATRRSLQTVCKQVGGVATKAEEATDEAQEDESLKRDVDAQSLAKKVQLLLEQSAALTSPMETQDVMDSEEENAPKSKRQRLLEPFGHAATPGAPGAPEASM
jgi:chromosome segregation ATPase